MRTNTLDTHGGCTHHAEADEKKGTKTVERKFSSVEVKRKRKKSWGGSTGYSYAAWLISPLSAIQGKSLGSDWSASACDGIDK